MKALESIPKDSKLVLDISRNVYTDYDIIEMLQDYSVRANSRNIEIVVKTKDEIISNPIDYYRLLKYFRTVNISQPQ